MIVEQKETPVEINGGSSQSNFSIAMNGKAFRVLSDTLYANKLGSIVRELSCNAYDAHVMAGKTDIPFVLHLPDAFEPWFSVQDQGVGLSPEDVSSVFTVYFQSTKEQSNDVIGAFGLGSKTPFSYTDQFTVTSVKDGTRTIYNAFINEQGIPNIIEMFSEETTEGNGVEIKLSVKREDYFRFNSEVIAQLQYFKVKPVLLNTTNSFANTVDSLFDTCSICIEKYNTGSYNKRVVALQGNVGYTLDLNQLRDKIDSNNYLLLTRLARHKVILKFNIGEIGVTASREGVEYTATTVKNICDKITAAKQEISSIINNKLTKEFTTDYSRIAYLNSDMTVALLSGGLVVPTADTTNGGNYYFNLNKFLTGTNAVGANVVVGSVTYHSRASKVRRSLSHTMASTLSPQAEGKLMIVFKDKSSLYSKKIEYLFSTIPNLQQVYCIEMFDKSYTKDLQDRLGKYLGGFTDIKMLSAVELPVAVREQQKRQSTIAKYYSFIGGSYADVRSYEKSFSELSSVKIPTVYFVVENLTPTSDAMNLNSLQDLSTFSSVLPVIAVRESAVEKLKQNPLFISLSKYIVDKKQELGTDEVKRSINRKYIIDAVNNSIPFGLTHKKELIIKSCPDNEITRLFKTLDKQKSIKQHSPAMNRFIGYQPATNTSVRGKAAKITDVVKNILEKYQVVSTLGNTYSGKEISDSHLIVYLNAVQSYTQQTKPN